MAACSIADAPLWPSEGFDVTAICQNISATKQNIVPQPSSVSIVMATFNGVDYLADQLSSLFRQTRFPDELVVYDDGSTDGTWDLLQDYAAKAPFQMKIFRADKNGGVNAAFRAALLHASCDVIFFCDQDDVWFPEKIEASLAALDKAPAAGFVFCDAIQFASSGRKLSETVWDLARFTPRRQVSFRQKPLETMISGGNFVYGMASAFRRHALEPFIDIGSSASVMTHDTWFALCATAIGHPGVALPQTLLAYRRHERQTSVLAGRQAGRNSDRADSPRLRFDEEIAAFRLVQQSVNRFAHDSKRDLTESLAILDRKIAFLETRAALRRERSALKALKATFNRDYWLLSRGLLSILRDYRGIW